MKKVLWLVGYWSIQHRLTSHWVRFPDELFSVIGRLLVNSASTDQSVIGRLLANSASTDQSDFLMSFSDLKFMISLPQQRQTVVQYGLLTNVIQHYEYECLKAHGKGKQYISLKHYAWTAWADMQNEPLVPTGNSELDSENVLWAWFCQC